MLAKNHVDPCWLGLLFQCPLCECWGSIYHESVLEVLNCGGGLSGSPSQGVLFGVPSVLLCLDSQTYTYLHNLWLLPAMLRVMSLDYRGRVLDWGSSVSTCLRLWCKTPQACQIGNCKRPAAVQFCRILTGPRLLHVPLRLPQLSHVLCSTSVSLSLGVPFSPSLNQCHYLTCASWTREPAAGTSKSYQKLPALSTLLLRLFTIDLWIFLFLLYTTHVVTSQGHSGYGGLGHCRGICN